MIRILPPKYSPVRAYWRLCAAIRRYFRDMGEHFALIANEFRTPPDADVYADFPAPSRAPIRRPMMWSATRSYSQRKRKKRR